VPQSARMSASATVARPSISSRALALVRSQPRRDVRHRPARRAHVVSRTPEICAREAGLTYVHHDRPGITRVRRRKSFQYFDPSGERIVDANTIVRIRALAIPPAYTDVWICPRPRGHIQAVGKDARGRTQYRYHPRWREVRDDAKYGRLLAFGDALPKIRAHIRKDLERVGLPRDKVLATVVKLLETTLIRVGNEEYVKSNKSYGLTTIRNDHVNVHGKHIHFEFRGKSGVEHVVDLDDKRLAAVIRQCQDLPEQELFEYVDAEGNRHPIGSSDVNAYLGHITGRAFTAKDFRTWAGTVLAAMALRELEAFDSAAQAKKNVVQAIESVAKKLGNTRAVCRKCYIHPAILDLYMEGRLVRALKATRQNRKNRSLRYLKPEEAAVMALLQKQFESGTVTSPAAGLKASVSLGRQRR
jgi:DNA topoisomerase I